VNFIIGFLGRIRCGLSEAYPMLEIDERQLLTPA